MKKAPSKLKLHDHDPHKLLGRPWLWWAWGVVIFFFVGVGSWAATATISGAVIANGTVNPESGIKTVQHPAGGVVKAILVKEGESVRAGQLLLKLDDTSLQAKLNSIITRYYADLSEIARLQAERDEIDEVQFPSEVLNKVQDPAIRKLVRTQLSLFHQRQRMMAGQREVLNQKIRALEERIGGLRDELHSRKAQLKLVREEIATVEGLLRKGQALKPRLLALKRTAASLEGDMGRLRGELAQAQKTIAEIKAQIITMKRDFLARVLMRLAELQKEAAALREQRIDLEKKVEETNIRAPVNGRVLDLRVRTIGGVVVPGQPIMFVVPDNEPLIIDARVKVTDIDEVVPQGEARVIISAFNTRNTPELRGHVQVISPAPKMDAITRQPYYNVQVVVPTAELRKLGEDKHLVPGMPAEVFITTKARTPLDIILSPFTDAMRRAFRS